MNASTSDNRSFFFWIWLIRDCGPGGKVLYLTCWFKVTLRVMGEYGGTMILRVGLTPGVPAWERAL